MPQFPAYPDVTALDGSESFIVLQAGVTKEATIAQIRSFLYRASTQSGTSYTADIDDAWTTIEFANGSPVSFEIPPNSSVAFPIGTEVEIVQQGAGVVTVDPGSGVTLNSRGGVFDLAGQYAVAMVKKLATDTWILTGDIV